MLVDIGKLVRRNVPVIDGHGVFEQLNGLFHFIVALVLVRDHLARACVERKHTSRGAHIKPSSISARNGEKAAQKRNARVRAS